MKSIVDAVQDRDSPRPKVTFNWYWLQKFSKQLLILVIGSVPDASGNDC